MGNCNKEHCLFHGLHFNVVHLNDIVFPKSPPVCSGLSSKHIYSGKTHPSQVLRRTQSGAALTGVWVYGEIRLSLKDAVDELSAVPVDGVIGIRSRNPGDRGTCGEKRQG